MKRTFLVGTRRTYELVSYDRDTHRAVLINEKGEEVIDPNFWPEMIKRAGYVIEER